MKKRRFNQEQDQFLIFFTVTTANDFNLNALQEVKHALKQEKIQEPKNLNQIIKEWLQEGVIVYTVEGIHFESSRYPDPEIFYKGSNGRVARECWKEWQTKGPQNGWTVFLSVGDKLIRTVGQVSEV